MRRGQIFFEYAPEFLNSGIRISPFMLPLRAGLFQDEKRTFDGLMGVFDDSLPDGWGRLLLDRELKKKFPGLRLTPLHRLAIAGKNCMGVAKKAGIAMPETRLFPSSGCPGFFGIRRFDRENGLKVHTHSACGLLHAPFRLPCMEYEGLLRLTMQLTRDMGEVVELYRRMVFNVMIQNYDDHTKNFSFRMDAGYQWKPSPAYDLVPAPDCAEHATTVNGKGKNITDKDMLATAKRAGIKKSPALQIIGEVKEAVSLFRQLKKEYS